MSPAQNSALKVIVNYAGTTLAVFTAVAFVVPMWNKMTAAKVITPAAPAAEDKK